MKLKIFFKNPINELEYVYVEFGKKTFNPNK